MPVPIVCHLCHHGRYAPRGPGSYVCLSCGSQATEAAFLVLEDELLVVHAGVLQVLAVPEGHQAVTPTRHCHAPHLGASLALALRLHRTRPVYPRAEDVQTAEDLLVTLDANGGGPWVLSGEQLGVLTRAMDVRYAMLPSTARQHPGFDAEIRAAHRRSRHPPAT